MRYHNLKFGWWQLGATYGAFSVTAQEFQDEFRTESSPLAFRHGLDAFLFSQCLCPLDLWFYILAVKIMV